MDLDEIPPPQPPQEHTYAGEESFEDENEIDNFYTGTWAEIIETNKSSHNTATNLPQHVESINRNCRAPRGAADLGRRELLN